MRSINTKCQGCVFLESVVGIQTGCVLNRPEKLGVKEAAETFILERFCNTYRPEEWLKELSFEESISPEEKVLNEVSIRMGYILDVSKENSESKVFDCLQAIKKAEPSWVSVVTRGPEWNDFIWSSFIQLFGEESDVNYHIVQVGKEEPAKILSDHGFKHAENGWVYLLKSSEDLPDLAQQKIDLNKVINQDLKQIAMMQTSEDCDDHGICFSAVLFKFLNGNRTKVYQDEQADSRSFVTKVRDAQKRTESNTIYTWNQINEKTP
jgi:hypothetical protein